MNPASSTPVVVHKQPHCEKGFSVPLPTAHSTGTQAEAYHSIHLLIRESAIIMPLIVVIIGLRLLVRTRLMKQSGVDDSKAFVCWQDFSLQ